MQRKVITIQNSEAIVRRDINDSGWYVLGIKKGYDSYYLTKSQVGDMNYLLICLQSFVS
jgi:hypothetical protein